MYSIIFLKCQNSCRIILDYRKTVIAGSCYFINNYTGSTQFSARLFSPKNFLTATIITFDTLKSGFDQRFVFWLQGLVSLGRIYD